MSPIDRIHEKTSQEIGSYFRKGDVKKNAEMAAAEICIIVNELLKKGSAQFNEFDSSLVVSLAQKRDWVVLELNELGIKSEDIKSTVQWSTDLFERESQQQCFIDLKTKEG